MDGFDHYGTIANLLAGVYAEYLTSGATLSLATTNPRTGAYALRATGLSTSPGLFWRRVLGGARTGVGQALGYCIAALPTANDALAPIVFRTGTNLAQVLVIVQSTGAIAVRQSSATGTLLGQTAGPVIFAGAYQYIEAFVNCHSSTGSVEVRVDGVTVLDISGVNTNPRATGEISQVSSEKLQTGAAACAPIDMDDLWCWNDLGSYNNDFPGNTRVGLALLDADTAITDWTRNTGATDFAATTQIPPDGDTTYIEAAAAGNVSEFGIADAPGSVTAIKALQTCLMMKKTDAGASQVQAAMVSGASVANGADRPITTTYTYWPDIFETDPATGAPWTPAGFNAAKLRLTRTV